MFQWSGQPAASCVCRELKAMVVINASYCVKYNQHAWHANARGVWGHATRNILKNRFYEIEFESISGL